MSETPAPAGLADCQCGAAWTTLLTGDRPGPETVEYYVRCPACGRQVTAHTRFDALVKWTRRKP